MGNQSSGVDESLCVVDDGGGIRWVVVYPPSNTLILSGRLRHELVYRHLSCAPRRRSASCCFGLGCNKYSDVGVCCGRRLWQSVVVVWRPPQWYRERRVLRDSVFPKYPLECCLVIDTCATRPHTIL